MMTKDLLTDLPRFRATAQFESQLLETSGVLSDSSTMRAAHLNYLAPFALAASLAIGLLIGGAEIVWLSDSLGSLGLISNVSYDIEVDVYASTFATLGG